MRDVDLLSRSVVKLATRHYRCMICTVNPWPDDTQEQEMALEAWEKACKEKDVELEFTEEILALVRLCHFCVYADRH